MNISEQSELALTIISSTFLIIIIKKNIFFYDFHLNIIIPITVKFHIKRMSPRLWEFIN